jgi:diguanylate cyclase (GGDEF)-like protein/PAS domain S-box-containing protein
MASIDAERDALTEPQAEIADLRARLQEAEALLEAIRSGQVDALLVEHDGTPRFAELPGAEHDYRAMIEEMGEGAMTLTADGHIYFANQRLAAMLETRREDLIGSALIARMAPASRKAYQAWLDQPPPRPQRRLDLRLLSAHGAEVPCHLSLTELPFEQKQGAFCAIATDLSTQKQAEDALRDSEQRLQALVEHLPVGVWLLERSGQIIYANEASRKIWNGARFVGPDQYSEYKAWRVGSQRPLAAEEWSATRAIRNDEIILDEELEIECFDGTRKVILASSVPIHDREGHVSGLVVLNQDITERKAAEHAIEELAYYDTLTGLPNRRLLLDRLAQVVASIKRDGVQGALLFLDLDHFKDLNDSLGHDIGDLMLQQVATRLRGCVRERDTVARLGGDEFVVVLAPLDPDAERAAAQVRTVVEKIQRVLTEPYPLGDHVQHSAASIGATLIDHQRTAVTDLLKQADLAMYKAKTSGRNQACFFDPQLQLALERRTAMERQLHDALRLEEFVLHYQPQVDPAGNLIAAEALLRWQHPEQGLLAPAQFIALTEESGLIAPLGSWILRAACEQLAAWSQRAAPEPFAVAVNISARQFREPGFVDTVRAAVRETGIDPQLLMLELTESLLLEDIDGAIDTMSELRALGLRFSLDDFGTGYSSLAYLRRLPLDELKIDRSFVSDVTGNRNDAAIVRAILALARELGLRVIAEGVETKEQHRFLAANGCDAFQGYLFGHPAPPESLFTLT